MNREQIYSMADCTLQDLVDTQLVALDPNGSYEPTLLGQAIVASSLTPEDGIFVHDELQRALRAFVLDGEMHVFNSFTPVQTVGLSEINWPTFRNEMEGLDDSGMRALQFIGVKPAFVNRMCGGLPSSLPSLDT